ncbi:hypothetical protein MHC_02020 [Mycoplasma haemocanis str. Illinois]|uniref:Uncharacterized protein n=1 Tax=Mycoplasma haemocanis (strain Illinois) TaxID=1111676 RepID=H6N6J8_MYCHN|nr:hypothetical protein [Mycoplasma haemocanis]AEW45270.1 hypothetical protein MHC_02020 [Mycoplasma haemocanis str. Illinois]
MNKTVLTVSGILGGGGAAAAGGYSIYSAIQPKTIREKLLKEGFRLLSDIKDANKANTAWEKVVSRYKVEVDDNSKIIDANASAITKDKISDWCKKNLDVKIENSLYSKASKWCVEFTSLEEKLKQSGRQLNANAQTLDGKYNSLPHDIKGKVDKVSVTASSHQNGEKIKQWCSDLSKRSFTGENDNHYQNLISHCI